MFQGNAIYFTPMSTILLPAFFLIRHMSLQTLLDPLIYTYTYTYIHTNIHTYIHTYRQTDIHTYIYTDRQTEQNYYIDVMTVDFLLPMLNKFYKYSL